MGKQKCKVINILKIKKEWIVKKKREIIKKLIEKRDNQGIKNKGGLNKNGRWKVFKKFTWKKWEEVVCLVTEIVVYFLLMYAGWDHVNTMIQILILKEVSNQMELVQFNLPNSVFLHLSKFVFWI